MVKNLSAKAGDASSIPGLGRPPWRRKWQPTPVFLPGESHGQMRLVAGAGVAKSWTRLSEHTQSRLIANHSSEKDLLMFTSSMARPVLFYSRHSVND